MKSLEERKTTYFSTLKVGDVLNGTVVELLSDSAAIVDIDGFLIRCTIKNRLKEGQRVRLKISILDPQGQQVVLKVLK